LNRADVINSASWLPARRRHLPDPNQIQTRSKPTWANTSEPWDVGDLSRFPSLVQHRGPGWRCHPGSGARRPQNPTSLGRRKGLRPVPLPRNPPDW